MSFPVFSTSVQTKPIKRLNKVMQRSKVAKRINRAGVFSCRPTAGTNLWSAHAFGAATDLMLKLISRAEAEAVARAVVTQATKRTIANRGKPVKGINFVIGGAKQWVRGQGWSAYTRGGHDNHVHAAEYGSTPKRPPCAG
jgi:hypothetical protein